MKIRTANTNDFNQIWPIFHEIVKAGDTYALSPETSQLEAKEIWLEQPRKTFIVEEKGKVLGTYIIKTNQAGPGEHVCNCAYMVSSIARGQGLATMMCEHSQVIARGMGYKGMQFNFVAGNNIIAIKLWQKLGFDTVGNLPKAFNHPKVGFIDALVMYKWL
jgi:L-amino acid N-acyltransferase YncA|tara:strand:+ start:182 stop:664 length:483 start_codon:yes stop_codon:yes gene_type:complete